MLTFVVIDEDVLVSRAVFVIVTVTDGDGEGVGSADHRVTAVLHYDGHVVVLLCLSVERPLRRHNPRALSVHTSTCEEGSN